MRKHIASALQVGGILSVSAGFGLLSLYAGLISLGVGLVALGVATERES